jgi:hypothetical protein
MEIRNLRPQDKQTNKNKQKQYDAWEVPLNNSKNEKKKEEKKRKKKERTMTKNSIFKKRKKKKKKRKKRKKESRKEHNKNDEKDDQNSKDLQHQPAIAWNTLPVINELFFSFKNIGFRILDIVINAEKRKKERKNEVTTWQRERERERERERVALTFALALLVGQLTWQAAEKWCLAGWWCSQYCEFLHDVILSNCPAAEQAPWSGIVRPCQ